MMPIWVPEVTFGNALCLTLIVFVYCNLRIAVRKNLELLKVNNNNAILAAGHAKLSYDTSAHNAAAIRSAVAETKIEIKAAVESITAAGHEYTPTATVLPAELRVTIAKETEAPAPAGK